MLDYHTISRPATAAVCGVAALLFLWTATRPILVATIALLLGAYYIRHHGLGREQATDAPGGEVKPGSGVVATRDREGSTGTSTTATTSTSRGVPPWRKLQSPVDILSSIFSMPQEVAVELGDLVELILKSFVYNWYQWISDDHQLLVDIRQSLGYAFGTLMSLMRSRLHLLSFLSDKALLAIQLHLHWYFHLKKQAALHHPDVFSEETTGVLTDEQYRCLLHEFEKSGRYHTSVFDPERAVVRQRKERKSDVDVSTSSTITTGAGEVGCLADLVLDPSKMQRAEMDYLRSLSSALVKRLFAEEDWSCRVVHHLCREVLATCILSLTGLMTPDNINYYLVDGLNMLSLEPSTTDGPGAVGMKPPATEALTMMQPGVAPKGFPKRHQGWKHFAGPITRHKATELLGKEKLGCFLFRRACEKPWEDDAYELVYVGKDRHDKSEVRFVPIRLTPTKYDYAARDAFFYENIMELAEGFESLDDLLQALSHLAKDGLVFKPPPTTSPDPAPSPTCDVPPYKPTKAEEPPLAPVGPPVASPQDTTSDTSLSSSLSSSPPRMKVSDKVGVPPQSSPSKDKDGDISHKPASMEGVKIEGKEGNGMEALVEVKPLISPSIMAQEAPRPPSCSDVSELGTSSVYRKETDPPMLDDRRMTLGDSASTVKSLSGPAPPEPCFALSIEEERHIRLVELKVAIEQILWFQSRSRKIPTSLPSVPFLNEEPQRRLSVVHTPEGVEAICRLLLSIKAILRYGLKEPHALDNAGAWWNLVGVLPSTMTEEEGAEMGPKDSTNTKIVTESTTREGAAPSIVDSRGSPEHKSRRRKSGFGFGGGGDGEESFAGGKWLMDNFSKQSNNLNAFMEKWSSDRNGEGAGEAGEGRPQEASSSSGGSEMSSFATESKESIAKAWRSLRPNPTARSPSHKEEKRKEEAGGGSAPTATMLHHQRNVSVTPPRTTPVVTMPSAVLGLFNLSQGKKRAELGQLPLVELVMIGLEQGSLGAAISRGCGRQDVAMEHYDESSIIRDPPSFSRLLAELDRLANITVSFGDSKAKIMAAMVSQADTVERQILLSRSGNGNSNMLGVGVDSLMEDLVKKGSHHIKETLNNSREAFQLFGKAKDKPDESTSGLSTTGKTSERSNPVSSTLANIPTWISPLPAGAGVVVMAGVGALSNMRPGRNSDDGSTIMWPLPGSPSKSNIPLFGGKSDGNAKHGKGNGRAANSPGHHHSDVMYSRNHELAERCRLVAKEVDAFVEQRVQEEIDDYGGGGDNPKCQNRHRALLHFLRTSTATFSSRVRAAPWPGRGRRDSAATAPEGPEPDVIQPLGLEPGTSVNKALETVALRLQLLLEKRVPRRVLVEQGIVLLEPDAYSSMAIEAVDVTTVYSDTNAHPPYASYYIKVHLVSPDGTPLSQVEKAPEGADLSRVWKVRRRYNDFQRLDKAIKSQVGSRALAIRLPALPPKRIGTPNRNVTEQRRLGLNTYLTDLLKHRLGSCHELYLFLTTNKMDPNQTSLTSTPHKQLRVSPVLPLHEEGEDLPLPPDSPTASGDMEGDTAQRLLNESFFIMEGFKLGVMETRFFGLVEEVFDFDNLNVVRRKILAIVRKAARTFFSGSLNRKLLAQYASLTSAPRLAGVFKAAKDSIWPNGVFLTPAPPRTPEEMTHTRQELESKLLDLVPTALGSITSILGQQCTEQGVMKVFEAVQCPFLMKNLMYTLLDVFLLEIFAPDPEVATQLGGLDSMRI